MNKNESKYFNTAQYMNEALLELLNKKEYEYISVKELCNKAGVNRSTFYLHYENMDDLLNETIENITNKLVSYYDINGKEFIEKISTCKIEELDLITPSYIIPFLQCIYENKNAYKAALYHPHIMQSDKKYLNLCKHIFFPILERYNVANVNKDYIIQISGSISTNIRR